MPEPELMDDLEQAKAYAEADFEESNSLFVRLFREHFDSITPALVLDLGCGPADITIRLAQLYPDTMFHAVDGSEAMLLFAKKRILDASLGDRIKLIRAFIPDDPLPESSYDAVVSNSLLHHLKSPYTLWSTIKNHASAGALILVMDLMRPDSVEEAQEIVKRYSGNEPEILKRDFFNSLCAAYTPEEVEEQIKLAGLNGLTVKQVSDRHLAVVGRI